MHTRFTRRRRRGQQRRDDRPQNRPSGPRRDAPQAGRRPDNRGAKGQASGEVVSGVVRLAPDGSGRLIPERLQRSEVYLPPEQIIGLRAGDRATIRVLPGRKGRVRGVVIARGARAEGRAVGVLRRQGRTLLVEPQPPGPPILVDPQALAGATEGDAVVLVIDKEATEHHPARGRIDSILGRADAPAVLLEMAVHSQGLSMTFSPGALAQADSAREPSAEEGLRDGRKDLRAVPHVTIDGEDARDFDDAVSARPENGGIRLWVSIADVSHYVTPNSALDEAARGRGTSVYFPHRAVPMLPERLSNDLCSLKPEVIRYTLTCEMVIGADGSRQQIVVYPSFIRSAARLTYTGVQKVLDGKETTAQTELISHLREAAARLRRRRFAAGALDLDLPEAHVILNPQGEPKHIGERERFEAHRLIEDLMIAANESVAEHLSGRQWPAVYRVHDIPDREKVATLARWAQKMGIPFTPKDAAEPRELARFLTALRGKPLAAVGSSLLLRSLAQARYRAENIGHYALASRAYLHFTSPIRRYPDLLVHRSLYALWRNEPRLTGLDELAEQASLQERRAMEAERGVVQLCACLVAQQHVGETFEARVVGVHRTGLFVRPRGLFVEGLLPIEALSVRGDWYQVLEDDLMLVAQRSGHTIRLGDPIEVRIAGVSLLQRHIDFVPAKSEATPSARGSSPVGVVNRANRTSGSRGRGAKSRRSRQR